MKIKDLIEILQKQDGNIRVSVWDAYHDSEEFEDINVSIDMNFKTKEYVVHIGTNIFGKDLTKI